MGIDAVPRGLVLCWCWCWCWVGGAVLGGAVLVAHSALYAVSVAVSPGCLLVLPRSSSFIVLPCSSSSPASSILPVAASTRHGRDRQVVRLNRRLEECCFSGEEGEQ